MTVLWRPYVLDGGTAFLFGGDVVGLIFLEVMTVLVECFLVLYAFEYWKKNRWNAVVVVTLGNIITIVMGLTVYGMLSGW